MTFHYTSLPTIGTAWLIVFVCRIRTTLLKLGQSNPYIKQPTRVNMLRFLFLHVPPAHSSTVHDPSKVYYIDAKWWVKPSQKKHPYGTKKRKKTWKFNSSLLKNHHPKRKVVLKPGKQDLKLWNDVGNHKWLHQLRRESPNQRSLKWMDFFNTPSLVNVGATFHIDTSQ